MVSEYIEKKWEDRANGYPDYITNTDMDTIFGSHKLMVPTNKSVLVIGVGWGQAVKDLVEHGNTVYATDVSQTLINVATGFGAKQVCLSKNISKLPPVDLAICHLVLQHNTEDEVFRLINEVQLTDSGIGSYQYSTLENDCKLTPVMIRDFNEGEQFFYSVDRMNRILSKTNKKKTGDVSPERFRSVYSFDWNFLRFRNK